MKTNIDLIFEAIKFECRSDRGKNHFEIAFELFFGSDANKHHNFIGGQNDKRHTLHENIFQALYPDLESQVTFGTGKGGYKKYLSKKYTADFLDRKNRIIYEIDGANHFTEIGILKDQIRDHFFLHELGIKTIHITNEKVEKLLLERLRILEQEGVLNELCV